MASKKKSTKKKAEPKKEAPVEVEEVKEAEPVVEKKVEPKAATTKIQTLEHQKTTIVFASAQTDEPNTWEVMGIRGARNSSTGRLEWHVSIKDAAKFEKHHFVQTGRIVKV